MPLSTSWNGVLNLENGKETVRPCSIIKEKVNHVQHQIKRLGRTWDEEMGTSKCLSWDQWITVDLMMAQAENW